MMVTVVHQYHHWLSGIVCVCRPLLSLNIKYKEHLLLCKLMGRCLLSYSFAETLFPSIYTGLYVYVFVRLLLTAALQGPTRKRTSWKIYREGESKSSRSGWTHAALLNTLTKNNTASRCIGYCRQRTAIFVFKSSLYRLYIRLQFGIVKTKIIT